MAPNAALAGATPTWGSVGQNLIGAGDAYAKFSGSMTASVAKFFFAGAAKYLGNPVSVRLAKLRLAESAFADYQNAQTSLDRLTSLLSAAMNTADGLLPGWAADAFNFPLKWLDRGVKLGDWLATQLIKQLYPEAFTVTATSSSVGLPDQKTGAVKGTAVFSNPGGGTLTYTATAPAHGTLTLSSSSSTGYTGTVLFTYTPDLAAQRQAELNGVVGTDSFTITATNAVADQDDTVKFTKIPVDPGTPQPGNPGSTQSTPSADGSVNVTIHTTDFPGGTIRYLDPMIPPKYGTISNFDGIAGTFTYTPKPDAAGTLSAGTPEQIAATQTTDDNGSVSGRAVFVNEITDSFSVTASNNVHTTSQAIAITTELDAPNGVTYAVTSGPANGTITAFDPGTGAYTYTPKVGTTATHDAFTVTATKGAQSATETIAVPVGEDPLIGTWVTLYPNSLAAHEITIRQEGGVYTQTLDEPCLAGLSWAGTIPAGTVVATFTRSNIDEYGNVTYTGTIAAEYIAAWNAANTNISTVGVDPVTRTIVASSVPMAISLQRGLNPGAPDTFVLAEGAEAAAEVSDGLETTLTIWGGSWVLATA